MLSDHQLCVFNDGSNEIVTFILQVEHILPLIYLLQIQNLFKILNGMYVTIYVVVITFPVLESFTPCPTNSVPRWNFNKADWDRFVAADTFQHDTDPIESVSNLLINIASDSIHKTSDSSSH